MSDKEMLERAKLYYERLEKVIKKLEQKIELEEKKDE